MNKIRMVKPMPIAKPPNYKNGSAKVNGFDSVHAFMEACNANDFIVHSFPHNRGDEHYVVVTVEAKTSLPVISWHVLDEYETKEIVSGISLDRDHFDLYSDIDRALRKVS